jgi:hypothetical protein
MKNSGWTKIVKYSYLILYLFSLDMTYDQIVLNKKYLGKYIGYY